jgi:hypothetical protein
MTDARLPDKWLGDPTFSVLSDPAWRLFSNALMWSNRYGTDGVIESRFLTHLLVQGDTNSQVFELIDSGLAVHTSTGIEIPWLDLGQSLASDVEKQRAQNRQRKAKQKERELTREGMREGMREVGQDTLGQDDTF